jgi:hypothetical protein
VNLLDDIVELPVGPDDHIAAAGTLSTQQPAGAAARDVTIKGDLLATLFSVYMLACTKGQQFTAPDLSDLLRAAGFEDVNVTPAHGSYAVVSARKP